MTTPTPPPGDLAAFGAALGIDPTTVTPGVPVKPRARVYWGTRHPEPLAGLGGPNATGYSIATGGTDPVKEYRDADAARLNVLTWTERELEDFAARLVAAGMLDEDHTRDEVEAAWGRLVDKAADYAAVGRDLSPFDLVDLYGRNPTANRKATPSKVVNRQMQLSDPDQARGLLNAALSADLGRRATPEELDEFQAALNDAQRANPVLSTSTTTTDGQGNTTVDTVNTGGVDETGLAQTFARSGDNETEFRHYQAATTYTNALFEALQAPV